MWVLAHECGHGAFAKSSVINDTVGYILHTLLLVPYFSWKYTHAGHHIATNDMSRDTVFLPHKRSDFKDEKEDFRHTPIVNVLHMLRMLLLGWPAYLIANASGQEYKQWTSHFTPSSPFFKKSQKWGVHASTVGKKKKIIPFIIFILFFFFILFSSFKTILFHKKNPNVIRYGCSDFVLWMVQLYLLILDICEILWNSLFVGQLLVGELHFSSTF